MRNIAASIFASLALLTVSSAQAAGPGGIKPQDDPTNHPPIAVDHSFQLTCNNGGPIFLFVGDSDPDGDTFTLTGVTTNGGFTISIANATMGIAAIVNGHTPGNYTGTYTITDSHGATATATIHVTAASGGPGCV
jgi:hypothetical protein